MRTFIAFGTLGVLAATGLLACSGPPGTMVIVGWASPDGGQNSSGGGGSGGAGGGGGTGVGSGSDSGTGVSADSGTKPGSDAGSGGSKAGVPCAVSTALSACVGCHSDPPLSGALTGLVTYADLTKSSALDSSKSEAAESLALMMGASPVMPPSGGASAADIAALQSWVSGGTLMGAACSSGSDSGVPPPSVTDPFMGAPAFSCTAGKGTHNAGQDCLKCHNGSGGGDGDDDAPQFAWAGTLYDKSGATVAGAEVRLVDATGKATSVCTTSSGTFYSGGSGFAAPAWVGTRNATEKQNMLTSLAATSGGCTSCHNTGSSAVTGLVELY
jgi:hypothetical protein